MAKTIRYFLYPLLLCAYTATMAQSTHYIKNEGQWPEGFDYKYQLGGSAVFLEQGGVVYHFVDEQDLVRKYEGMHESRDVQDNIIDHHAYRVKFKGANLGVEHKASDKLNTYNNYILGNDPSLWRGHVGLYQKVTYEEIYRKTDIQYYFSDEGNMKYDFILHPRANPKEIVLEYTGVDTMFLSYGNLVLRTSIGDVLESAPYAYQIIDGMKKEVKCIYKLRGNELHFDLDKYDRSKELIIDPVLVFSTFTGASANNFGYTATYGSDGSLYAGGVVFNDGGQYPTTTGAFKTFFQGGDIDVSISKFSPNGNILEYSTYLGGNSSEMPHSLVENPDGELVIFGNTGSNNFPVTSTAAYKSFKGGTFKAFFRGIVEYYNGVDIFVSTLSSDGSSMVASTYIGGNENDAINEGLDFNYGDRFRGEVTVDSTGNVYVASCTRSNDFPVAGNYVNSNQKGQQEGILFSFHPDLSSLRWGTYISGSHNDALFSVKFQLPDRIYFSGGTASGDMPMPDSLTYLNSNQGGVDGYVGVLDGDLGKLEHSSYLGTINRDVAFFVDFDIQGHIYLFGQTNGPYPVIGDGVYENPNSSQFLHKLDETLHTTLKSTVFGSGTSLSNISPTALMVDDCRNIYISGWGGVYNNNQGNTFGMDITKNALQQNTDGSDFYFLVMDATWKKINYASYFGSQGTEHVDGGTSRFSKDGTIYQAVCAGCFGNNLFPTTPNAYSSVNGSSSGCNLAVIKLQMESQKVIADAELDQDSACIPFTANVTNTSYNADYFIWVYPDGTTDTTTLNSIDIQQPGDAAYKLIAIDTTCNLVDTTEINLFGFTELILSDFKAEYDSCDNVFEVDLTNLSQNANSYFWDFGDGTFSQNPNPKHQYDTEGTYTIKLVSYNSSCQTIDSTESEVTFIRRTDFGDFNVFYEPCRDSTSVLLVAKGQGFQRYEWDLGDGNTATGKVLHYTFADQGSYNVTLSSTDTVCNRFFSEEQVVDILGEGDRVLQMPNVFTPDGDGLNDELGLTGKYVPTSYQEYQLTISNRWGSTVFESSYPGETWDGTFDSKPLEEGVYFYLINYSDNCGLKKESKGFVHLMR